MALNQRTVWSDLAVETRVVLLFLDNLTQGHRSRRRGRIVPLNQYNLDFSLGLLSTELSEHAPVAPKAPELEGFMLLPTPDQSSPRASTQSRWGRAQRCRRFRSAELCEMTNKFKGKRAAAYRDESRECSSSKLRENEGRIRAAIHVCGRLKQIVERV